MKYIIVVVIKFIIWHAPLGVVHSAKHRHQSPEWTILSDVNFFIRGEVTVFQVSLHPRSTRASQWSTTGKLLRYSWHMFYLATTCMRKFIVSDFLQIEWT